MSFAKIHIATNSPHSQQNLTIIEGIRALLKKVLNNDPHLTHIVIQEVNKDDFELAQWRSLSIDGTTGLKTLENIFPGMHPALRKQKLERRDIFVYFLQQG